MSDSEDLDAELLQVAGQGKRQAKGKRRRDDSDASMDESEEEEEWQDSEDEARRSKKPSAKKKSGRRKVEEEDDEPEFHIAEDELIEDEEDRRRLAAMPEARRELEIFERSERRRKELERKKLLNLVGGAGSPGREAPAKRKSKEKEREKAPPSTRKKAAADKAAGKEEEEDGAPAGQRAVRSGREVREEAAKKSAMEELKAARERKARTTEEKSRKWEEKGSGSEEGLAGEGEDEELSEELGGGRDRDDEVEISDLEEEQEFARRPRSRQEGEEEEEEASYEELKSITVRRHKLEAWANEPFFEDTMPGCMVRLAMGERPGEDGIPRPVYMLAMVVEVEERAPGVYKDSGQPWRSPYPFGGNKTSKWLRVARGFSERGMPLAQVSNQPLQRDEFEAWQRACREQRRSAITVQDVAEVRERLLRADNYTYTAEDVARLVAAKRATGSVANAALEKARQERLQEAARERGDLEEVARLDSVIANLDAKLAESKASRTRKGVSMASINKRNADRNFQNAYDNVSNKVEGAFTAKSAKSTTLDPFSRRATRPMVYWNTKQRGEDDDELEEGNGAGPAGAEQALSPRAAAAAAAADEAARAAAAALENVVDLSGLDLSLLDEPPRMPQIARKLLGSRWQLSSGMQFKPPTAANGGKLLTLQDYKRRQGLA